MGSNASSGKLRWAPLLGRDPLRLADSGGKVGLRNLGNTCFMNTGLQCLCHLEPFVAYFLTGKYREELNLGNPLGSGGQIATAVAQLQQALWTKNQNAFNPRELHRVLRRHASHLFEGHEQQDVQEFLAFCIDALHEDLNLVAAKPLVQTEDVEAKDAKLAEGKGEEFAAALAWLRYLQHGKSFLVDLFQGQVCDQLTCLDCGFKRRRFEALLYLSVPVTRKMSRIQDAISLYLTEETLTGDERWLCPKCDRKVDAKKKICIWKLPPVLVLHLKRFSFDARTFRFDKIDVTLEAPPSIDLSPFVTSPQREHALYDIVAVANHHGSFGAGHYTSYCRVSTSGLSDESKWYNFNDDRVSLLSNKVDAVSKDAYVIFLVRRASDGQEIRRQTVSLPEVWPHFASERNSIVQNALGARNSTAPGRRRSVRDFFANTVGSARGVGKKPPNAAPSAGGLLGGAPSAGGPLQASVAGLSVGREPPVCEPPRPVLASSSIARNCESDDDWDCTVAPPAGAGKRGMPSSRPSPLRQDEATILALCQMGFARAQVIEALEKTNSDLHRAISLLSRARRMF